MEKRAVQLVARLCCALGLRPREIRERYPSQFPNASAVYRIKRNLVERLRRDPEIREFLGLSALRSRR